MPTENELKFVLDPGFFPGVMGVDILSFPCCLIHQGYLFSEGASSLRVRSSENRFDRSLVNTYSMTFKRKVGGRVVEINTEIDERDFVDLWGCSKIVLRKIRRVVEGWEIDFFIDPGDCVYFVLAECEMPEGQDKPTGMPSLVKESLVYEVSRDDDRFSSKKLADIRYAQEILKELRKERA